MSVTLKFADEDAGLIFRILKAVANDPDGNATPEEFKRWHTRIKAQSTQPLKELEVLASAFLVAVRANKK